MPASNILDVEIGTKTINEPPTIRQRIPQTGNNIAMLAPEHKTGTQRHDKPPERPSITILHDTQHRMRRSIPLYPKRSIHTSGLVYPAFSTQDNPPLIPICASDIPTNTTAAHKRKIRLFILYVFLMTPDIYNMSEHR